MNGCVLQLLLVLLLLLLLHFHLTRTYRTWRRSFICISKSYKQPLSYIMRCKNKKYIGTGFVNETILFCFIVRLFRYLFRWALSFLFVRLIRTPETRQKRFLSFFCGIPSSKIVVVVRRRRDEKHTSMHRFILNISIQIPYVMFKTFFLLIQWINIHMGFSLLTWSCDVSNTKNIHLIIIGKKILWKIPIHYVLQDIAFCTW